MNKEQNPSNRAERDYAEEKGYNPPTKTWVRELVEGYSDKEIKDIKSYKEGWHNAKKQDKD